MENLIAFAQSETGQLIGYVLIIIGFLDIFLMHFVIGPQMKAKQTPEQRQQFERIKPLIFTMMAFLSFVGIAIVMLGQAG